MDKLLPSYYVFLIIFINQGLLILILWLSLLFFIYVYLRCACIACGNNHRYLWLVNLTSHQYRINGESMVIKCIRYNVSLVGKFSRKPEKYQEFYSFTRLCPKFIWDNIQNDIISPVGLQYFDTFTFHTSHL